MERISKFRAVILLFLVFAIVFFLGGRLYYLQIIETGGDTDNTTTFTTVTRVKAARGSLLDCNGTVLVGNRASYDLVINHYVLTNSANPNQSLYDLVKLCQTLGIEYTEHLPVTEEAPFQYTLSEASSNWVSHFQKYLESRGLDSDITAPLLIQELRKSYSIPDEWTDEEARAVLGLRYELSLRTVEGTGLSNFVFLSDVDNDTLSAIAELSIPGMNVEASTVREYYTDAAAHVLGYVGAMSPEQWEYYKTVDKVEGIADYLMDAEVGQTGFEYAFEEYLHGIDGWRYDEVTADGTVINTWYDPAPIAGSNVEVTLDLTLQTTAEDALENRIAQLRSSGGDGHDAEGGAVVVMGVKTGEILASASYPTYNLSTFYQDYDELVKTDYNPLINRVLKGLYPPGSTYKMSMVIAGIDSGTINSETEFEDKGIMKVNDQLNMFCLRYTNYGTTHGMVTASIALKVSCNYFFYELASRMDISTSDAVAKGLGLGESTGVELSEYIGYRANRETRQQLYAEGYQSFLLPDRLQSSIGQSDNRFTPLQLCVYTSTIANQGVRYRATYLNRVVSSDYRTVIYDQLAEVMSTMTISDEAHRAVVEGMKLVTSESGGTAYSIFKNYPVSVAGKTGTAQNGFVNASDHGAFVCFAPADDPQIAIVVYVEKAGHGTSVVQVAKDILDVYFKIGEDTSLITGENALG